MKIKMNAILIKIDHATNLEIKNQIYALHMKWLKSALTLIFVKRN